MASQPLPAAWAAYEVAERDQDGNPPLMSDDDEQLLQQYHDVLLTLGSDLEQGVGKLFITSRWAAAMVTAHTQLTKHPSHPRRVIWLSEEDQQRGIAIPFSDIAMHAMCSDTSSFPRPCVYAQLQSDFAEEGSDDEAGADDATELRFSPQDAGAVLEPMFKAFCEGAAMNPDEDLQGAMDGTMTVIRVHILVRIHQQQPQRRGVPRCFSTARR